MSCEKCKKTKRKGWIACTRVYTSDGKWTNVGVDADGMCDKHLWEALETLSRDKMKPSGKVGTPCCYRKYEVEGEK